MKRTRCSEIRVLHSHLHYNVIGDIEDGNYSLVLEKSYDSTDLMHKTIVVTSAIKTVHTHTVNEIGLLEIAEMYFPISLVRLGTMSLSNVLRHGFALPLKPGIEITHAKRYGNSCQI